MNLSLESAAVSSRVTFADGPMPPTAEMPMFRGHGSTFPKGSHVH